MTHEQFVFLPVYLWIVLLKLDEFEDKILFSYARDCEKYPFYMCLIMKNYVYYFRYLASFIKYPINIIDWYNLRKFACI